MTNAVVTINGARGALPTVLGQGRMRIPTGGKIRAGIKVLTRKAADNNKAKEIYDKGVSDNRSFEEIEREITRCIPELKTRSCPRMSPGSPCGRTTFPMGVSPLKSSAPLVRTAATVSGAYIASR